MSRQEINVVRPSHGLPAVATSFRFETGISVFIESPLLMSFGMWGLVDMRDDARCTQWGRQRFGKPAASPCLAGQKREANIGITEDGRSREQPAPPQAAWRFLRQQEGGQALQMTAPPSPSWLPSLLAALVLSPSMFLKAQATASRGERLYKAYCWLFFWMTLGTESALFMCSQGRDFFSLLLSIPHCIGEAMRIVAEGYRVMNLIL